MSKNHKPKLIVIVGPTACGKTELALNLAKEFKGEIISADSRAIYREMNIGTAKPKGRHAIINKQQAIIVNSVPNYMIDIINPDKEFTVAQFKQMAIKIIKHIHKRNKIPFLVGGTGLYTRAIVDNLIIPRVAPDKKLRQKLEKDIKNKGINYAWQKLIKLDPGSEDFVQKQNPRRIIRALEVCLKTKKPFSQLRKKGKSLFRVVQIGISLPRQTLYQKINLRTDKMIKAGLIQEVKKLTKKYPHSLVLSNTICYQEIIPYLSHSQKINESDLKQIIELIKKNTRHYARRQITWFKKDKTIKWVKGYKEAENFIKNFLT